MVFTLENMSHFSSLFIFFLLRFITELEKVRQLLQQYGLGSKAPETAES